MGQNTKDFTCTVIGQDYKNITKQEFLNAIEKALNEFADCDTISEISFTAIVRIEQKAQ